MKFEKPFYGVKSGEIYPTQFVEGDECPVELVEAARSIGAIGAETKAAKKAPEAKGADVAPETK